MPPADLGPRLREARIRAGLTQQDLATRLRVSYASIRKWERGEKSPTGLYRQAVVEWLAEAEGKGEPEPTT